MSFPTKIIIVINYLPLRCIPCTIKIRIWSWDLSFTTFCSTTLIPTNYLIVTHRRSIMLTRIKSTSILHLTTISSMSTNHRSNHRQRQTHNQTISSLRRNLSNQWNLIQLILCFLIQGTNIQRCFLSSIFNRLTRLLNIPRKFCSSSLCFLKQVFQTFINLLFF